MRQLAAEPLEAAGASGCRDEKGSEGTWRSNHRRPVATTGNTAESACSGYQEVVCGRFAALIGLSPRDRCIKRWSKNRLRWSRATRQDTWCACQTRQVIMALLETRCGAKSPRARSAARPRRTRPSAAEGRRHSSSVGRHRSVAEHADRATPDLVGQQVSLWGVDQDSVAVACRCQERQVGI